MGVAVGVGVSWSGERQSWSRGVVAPLSRWDSITCRIISNIFTELVNIFPADQVLALHGGGGGEAGGLAALVLRLLRQPGQVLPLSLRPVLVSLRKTNLNYLITRNIFRRK